MSSAGQILGGVVGGTIGFFAGNPFLGAQLGMMLGGYLDPPKGPTVEGPRLTDKTVQTSTYGTDIPTLYGTVAVNGNVFWLENNTLKEVVTKKKSGGKGGGSKTTTKTYSYYATFAVGLCKGPVIGIRRIWIANRLFYDAGSSDPATIQASNQASALFAFYPGTDTQMPDPRMQATLGVDNTPAYRGLAYIVFYDLPLANYGNSLMGAQVRVEIVASGDTTAYTTADGHFANSRSWSYQSKLSYGNGVFCTLAGGVAICATSSDGLTWTEYALPMSANWSGCAFGAGVFVAMDGLANTQCCTSPDGVTWTLRSLGGSYSVRSVAWNGSHFIATTYWQDFLKSSDGITWTNISHPSTNSFVDIAWNGSVWCALCSVLGTCVISASGALWTSYSMPSTGYGLIAALNGKFCALKNSTPTIALSTDGITWNTYAAPFPANIINSLVSIGDRFFAIGLQNKFWASYDGINWTNYTISSSQNWMACYDGKGVCIVDSGYGNSKYISLGLLNIYDPTLASITSSECLQSGLLTAGDLDVSALTQSVRGYRIGTVGAIRSALEPLQAAWPFDIRQHGYKIQFVNRGSSAVATIPLADLGAGTGDPVVMTTIQRTPDLSLPRRTSVRYLDYDREYNTGEQYASRDTVQSYNVHSVDFPLVLTGTEAAGMAETLLYLYWMERYELEFSLPATYNNLEPADVVNLTTPEGVVSVRLVGVNNTSTNIVECKGRFNSAAVYSPTAVAATPVTAGNTTITPLGGVKYELLDIPMVSSAQSSPSFLLAMTGLLDGWKGGTLMQSTDSGATWYSLQDVDPPGTTMGYCSNSIGVVDSRTVDSASVLSVTMTQGDLYSVTQAAMFGGQNYFAYGADGRWEIIAIQTCTLVSASNYNLTNMLRGRAGTEWAMGLHQAGDALILLDTTDVSLVNSTSDMIGVPSVYRGITLGRDISTDSNKSFTYRAVNLMPLSPINLTGSIDAVTGDWTLSFTPRTRDTSSWRDFVDSAFVESSEAYQIDVFSDNTYTSVKRTLSASTPSVSYSSASQTIDFGGNQNTLYLKIYQMSSAVGRGYPLTSSVTR